MRRRNDPLGSLTLVALGCAALLPALGSSTRLSYHEAIVAQGAREMLRTGDWVVPAIGSRPWLEKPPLSHWLTAAVGSLTGKVDEWRARLPSAVAAIALALGIAQWTSRRFGATTGWLAGAVQLTTVWSVTRGRLADADMVLACLGTWTILAFDDERQERTGRFPFFSLLGMTALAKGIGFGAAIVAVVVGPLLLWDRDRATARRLAWPLGWAQALLIASVWPLCVSARHPEALGLWFRHLAGRFQADQFASEPWWEYASAPLLATLPWTPLAVAGAWRSWSRARRLSLGPDRLLWCWALGPALLVTLASARNAHYLLPALSPWSIWAALALRRVGARLRVRRWPPHIIRSAVVTLFVILALAWAIGYSTIAPCLDSLGKGAEWAFYEKIGRGAPPGEPIIMLYDSLERPDRWDRAPYQTPFGPVPADLAVRLFYLGRPAQVCFGPHEIRALSECRSDPSFGSNPSPRAWLVIARARDRPELESIGEVREVARGPEYRFDRTFVAYRVSDRSRLPVRGPSELRPFSCVFPINPSYLNLCVNAYGTKFKRTPLGRPPEPIAPEHLGKTRRLPSQHARTCGASADFRFFNPFQIH